MSQMPDDHQSWLNDARSHAAAGDHLLAYDVATHGLERHPGDAALKHAAVLALARSGATVKARERYSELGLGNVSRGDVPSELYTDIASLGARIARDLALGSDPEQRQQLLTQAAHGYREIFEETGNYYPGVNAATLALLAGSAPAANALAASVRAICERRIANGVEHGYYIWATLAEVHLIARDEAAAAEALSQAQTAADAKPDALATTRRQLRLVCAATGMPASLLNGLRPRIVVHYAGHMIGPRFSEAQTAALAPRVEALLSQRDGRGRVRLASVWSRYRHRRGAAETWRRSRTGLSVSTGRVCRCFGSAGGRIMGTAVRVLREEGPLPDLRHRRLLSW